VHAKLGLNPAGYDTDTSVPNYCTAVFQALSGYSPRYLLTALFGSLRIFLVNTANYGCEYYS
jgi:hypothetical protein